jgi:[ribosomal protein S18]-alanine N-acetyltransferase
LRRGRREDLASLARLERLCFDAPWGPTLLAGDLERRDSVLLVAEGRGGGIAGYALLRRVSTEGELLRLAVDPDLRGQGIGKRLHAEGLAHLERLGVREAFLEVRSDNQGAIALYEASGWQRFGLRKGYYQDGGDALLYRRQL